MNAIQSNQPSVTIVSVTGHQNYAQSSAYAIARSYQELKERVVQVKCLLVSPERPADCPDFIQHVACQPFGYFEYNVFMLYSLDQLIDTDFALVVQHDGWLMNGENWQNEFFNFDYIGGPILNLVEFENGKFSRYLHFSEWEKYWQNVPENMREQQNGGFSLRSKKLLSAPRTLGLTLDVIPPERFELSKPVKITWGEGMTHSEDQYLCGYRRLELENYGIKFAPMELAAYFSSDRLHWQIAHNIPLDKICGAHGSSFVLISEDTLLYREPLLSKEQLLSDYYFHRLMKKGYKFHIKSEDAHLFK